MKIEVLPPYRATQYLGRKLQCSDSHLQVADGGVAGLVGDGGHGVLLLGQDGGHGDVVARTLPEQAEEGFVVV